MLMRLFGFGDGGWRGMDVCRAVAMTVSNI